MCPVVRNWLKLKVAISFIDNCTGGEEHTEHREGITHLLNGNNSITLCRLSSLPSSPFIYGCNDQRKEQEADLSGWFTVNLPSFLKSSTLCCSRGEGPSLLTLIIIYILTHMMVQCWLRTTSQRTFKFDLVWCQKVITGVAISSRIGTDYVMTCDTVLNSIMTCCLNLCYHAVNVLE